MLIIIIDHGAQQSFMTRPLKPYNAVGADVAWGYSSMEPWCSAPSIFKRDVSFSVDEADKATSAACSYDDGLFTYRAPQAMQLVACTIMNSHLPTVQVNLKHKFQIQWQEFRPSGQPM